jgi:hypothetical protein
MTAKSKTKAPASRGRKLDENETRGIRRGEGIDPADAEPGDFWHFDNHWYARPPRGPVTRLYDTVIEHEDGSITVHPDLHLNPVGGWQGRLDAGIWIEQ